MTSRGYPVALLPPDCGDLLANLSSEYWAFAPYPNQVYSAAGALAFLGGITGRSWNINGAGLNQYIVVIGDTGTGKDAIASGTARLLSALERQVEGAADFRGPGELVSSAGLIKWLDRKPCILSVLGEIGYLIQSFGNPKAPPHIKSLERASLQLYSKSGFGNTFDPSAYSDKDKNTGVIQRPSWTFIGDATGSSVYPHLSVDQIASGFLPRCAVFESSAPRPNIKAGLATEPNPQTIAALATVAAQALNLASRNEVQHVAVDGPASALLSDFERHATASINAGNEVVRQLWNRAHLKALKFAALPAVSRNMWAPVVGFSDAEWACALVAHQTGHLIGKFERNEVGAVEGDEAKQRAAVLRIIAEYCSNPYVKFEKYRVAEPMHRMGVVTHSYLSRRLGTLPAFTGDRGGATAALKRALQRLLEDDELRELPGKQMTELFGCKPRAFMMANSQSFAEALNITTGTNA